jgi:serine/threonine protein kinase
MAPETIKKLENTRFSDIWSLGCTIIEMIQGFPPWNKYKNPLSVLNIIYKSESPPEIPNNISNVLKDFLNKCLVMEPKDRWNIYQLKKHAFVTGESFGSIYKTISEEITLNVDERSFNNNSQNFRAEKGNRNLRNIDNNTFEKDGL